MDIRRLIHERPVAFASLAAAVGLCLGAVLTLAFVSAPPAPAPDPTPTISPVVETPSAITFTPVAFDALEGWSADPLDEILPALKRSCDRIANDTDETMGDGPAARPMAAWRTACGRVLQASGDVGAFRAAIAAAFTPHRISTAAGDEGTFTGYYEATLNGSLSPTATFKYPLYAPPPDLISVTLKDFVPTIGAGTPATLVGRVDGRRLKPYFVRADIDADAFRDRAEVVAWIDDPVAVHILHIQGSGQVSLPNGEMIRVGFAAHNGHAFTGLGKILLDEKVLKPGEASMIGVRDWLRRNPDRAVTLMNRNARYIFFRRIEGDGPIGAEGVALTRLRSLAVDPRATPLGAPVWVETADPDNLPLNRLMMAQDVGAAITGAVRGDVFWGAGDAAFDKAARMKSKGRLTVLLPRTN